MKITTQLLALSLSFAVFITSKTQGQQNLPVIQASKPMVSIRDGKLLAKDVWKLTPTTAPDIYYAQVPRAERKITFITDKDSISFTTTYGKTYDFIILMNGQDRILTRISANYEQLLNPTVRSKPAIQSSDTIPFFMKNSRLYFKGNLNGYKNLTIMFDLGAGITCLSEQSPAKAAVKFDGHISVQNTDGTNNEPSASTNSLEIGGLRWDKVPLVQIRNLADGEDMIIGNSLFRDKIIEVDYEKKIMILSDHINKNLQGYQVHYVDYFQHRPRFEVNIKVGERDYPFHFLFDTGRDGSMLIGDDFTNRYHLWSKYHSLFSFGRKKIIVIPELKIGSQVFKNIVTNTNNPDYPNAKQSLLGNKILNQFNFILDNRSGKIYLKANKYQNDNYSAYNEFKLARMLIVILIIGLLLFIGYRIRKSYLRKRSLL
ncbi:retropepsin-like domain-containing protein [Sphingobacterium sp. ML3W]|uniref:retropepsin-like aspartic protease n=1 Tax=Sphingobacterium sp. ML3W TaxID=1538644 RepID=UPI00249C17C2|nr:retropepsin-like aspartic protease [Sphingobacterium sp. ML3W]WFA81578.1 retropepsin-like domain-containing protein [Sphingobacterium sp. ML3W]